MTRLRQQSALIFDCDGTLVDNAALHCRAWTVALASAGAELRDGWYYERVGIPAAELLRQFREQHRCTFDDEEVFAAQARFYLANLQDVRAVGKVERIARSARVPMGVASGGQRSIVEATLRAAGLRELFEVIVTIEDVGRGKPEPHLFLETARRLNAAPEHCLVFEDSDEGLEGARRAGMRFIDVRTLRCD